MKNINESAILDQIDNPAHLKALSESETTDLCQEIRDRIVSTVTRNGGHLGSNLGIVELTVALHRVLDSPNDVLLFDTGHQTYVHKLLTGRVGKFDQIRQVDGLSGYPSSSESEHDWIENSHASTVLGYAHGLATAFSLNGPTGKRRVVAVIGDGSMTGGMAFEGLNNLGHSNANVTIVLNDNGRSYAPTVSHLSDSLVKIRSNPIYMDRQRRFERWAEEIPIIGKPSITGIKAWKAAVREAFEPTTFFEPLGIRYMGPFDGHNIEEVETALINAGEFEGPVLVHVQTQKGKGYGPAENDNIKNMHDTSGIKPGSYTAGFSDALVRLGEAHPNVVAITAAMPDSTGLLPFREKFPDRCFDVGIAEQHAVTAAAGMAMGGLRPVVAIYSTFLTRAFDQVNLDVGLHGQPVIFCLDRAGITGDDGPSHHGILDLVLMSKVPDMTIFCPSSFEELEQMMNDAYDLVSGPACIRWPKTAARTATPDRVGSGLTARLERAGSEICLIGVGKMLDTACQAADILAESGFEPTVWDPRVVKPLDPVMLTNAADHKLVVTIEDGLAEGGIGSSISLALNSSETEVLVLGVPTRYIDYNKPDAILAALGLDAPGVVDSIRSRLTTNLPNYSKP